MTKNTDDEMQDWSQFVLLLVDVQNDFWTDEIAVAFPNYEKRVSQLLAFCRQAPIDVVHLHAEFQADRSDWMAKYQFLDAIPCIEGTEGAQVLPFAKEAAGETVLVKHAFDGFLGGELDTYLQRNNKQFLLVAGIETSVCVLLTAASAAQRGYLVSIVEDCCADLPTAHEHTLERYPFIFSRTSVDQIKGKRKQWLSDLEKLATG